MWRGSCIYSGILLPPAPLPYSGILLPPAPLPELRVLPPETTFACFRALGSFYPAGGHLDYFRALGSTLGSFYPAGGHLDYFRALGSFYPAGGHFTLAWNDLCKTIWVILPGGGGGGVIVHSYTGTGKF